MSLNYFVPFNRTNDWYNKDWPEISRWCDKNFGSLADRGWNRSTMSPTGFWFANEKHKTLFLLRWSGIK